MSSYEMRRHDVSSIIGVKAEAFSDEENARVEESLNDVMDVVVREFNYKNLQSDRDASETFVVEHQ